MHIATTVLYCSAKQFSPCNLITTVLDKPINSLRIYLIIYTSTFCLWENYAYKLKKKRFLYLPLYFMDLVLI